MRLFLAIDSSGGDANRLGFEEGHDAFLGAFPYRKTIDELDEPKHFILDSGAFSAWKSGMTVDVRDYGAYAVKLKQRWPQTVVINLDVIPGTPERTASAAEKAAGIDLSIRNADYLRSLGLVVIEVYHQFEPVSFLHKLVERREPTGLLGLSPRNNATSKVKQAWLRDVLGHFVANGGKAAVPPCHGFGATAFPFMLSFPFATCDSTTWITPRRYGSVNARHSGFKGKMMGEAYGLPNGKRARIDTKKHAAAVDRMIRLSLHSLQRMERDATSFWSREGFQWNPP